MTFGQEVLELFRVLVYVSPKHEMIPPQLIRKNVEYIEIITEGSVRFDGDSERNHYGKGAIFRHLPGEKTVYKVAPDITYQCLVLCFTTTDKVKRDYPRLAFWQDLKTLDSFVKGSLSSFHDPSFDRKVLGAYIYSTVNWHSSFSEIQGNLDMVPPNLILNACEFLKNNTESSISVKELAEMYGLSKSYFQSLFKKHVGVTPHQYRINRRVSLACEALVSEEKSIKEISSECGFENLENFYRAFKRLTGVTPAIYRRKESNY